MDDRTYEYLVSIGVIGIDGVTRRARGGRCHECNRRTLIGLDADRAAWAVEIDAEEIDRVGEVLALASGRTTYTLRFIGGRWEIDYRSPWEIGPHRSWPVYAKHVCGSPLPIAQSQHPKLVVLAARARQSTASSLTDPPF